MSLVSILGGFLTIVLWRKKWEIWGHKRYKNKLIKYNLEDCLALIHIKKWLCKLKNSHKNILIANDLAHNPHLTFGKTNYVIEKYDRINSAAYFDYQRSKIYLRTNKLIKKSIKKKSKKHKIQPNTTKTPERPKNCPKCNCNTVYIHRNYQRILIDLKFGPNGIKRWVTKLKGHRYRCKSCRNAFTDPDLYRQSIYGENLGIWAVNNYIKYGISYGNLKEMLNENFNIDVTRTYISRQKQRFALKHQQDYEKILDNILNSPIIHIDETTAKVKKEKCYVWVLTNMTNVYYILRPNRECDFLREYLDNYNGVLISDYFTGYDSFNCKQQKCLIHLIRDINDLVLRNPTCEDLVLIAKLYGSVLNKIICTIDKYGLKKRNLNKHKKSVNTFYKKLNTINVYSEAAIKLQKRLVKNSDRLFTFLDYNGVPWNNNNAEHAIKAFAKYRRMADGTYNQTGLQDSLLLLSISQTCSLQGKSFLDFLKGEASLENE